MRSVSGSRGRWAACLLAAATATLASGCSTSPAAAPFHPGATASSAPPDVPSAPAVTEDHGHALAMPPFGSDVHIAMTGWLPFHAREVPAVIADKDFLLSYLYAEYRGNADARWTRYARGPVAQALQGDLSEPSVTTESFTGTIRLDHMSAFPDPSKKDDVDVSLCFDNAQSKNTSISTGKPLADQGAPDQHYYLSTDVLARGRHHRWQVVAIYPSIYYPRARECKP